MQVSVFRNGKWRYERHGYRGHVDASTVGVRMISCWKLLGDFMIAYVLASETIFSICHFWSALNLVIYAWESMPAHVSAIRFVSGTFSVLGLGEADKNERLR